MQTPAQRKQLIREGRYDQLEAPTNIGFGLKTGFPAAPQQVPHAIQQVFGVGGADRATGEREPGEEG